MTAEIDPAARLRRHRRRQTWRLVLAVGAILAPIAIGFVVLFNVTAPRSLAERTFVTAAGNRIDVQVSARGDRITGLVEVSGPGLPNASMMSIDFPAGPRPARRVRIDFDAQTSRVLMDADGSEVAVGLAIRGGGVGFSPVTTPATGP